MWRSGCVCVAIAPHTRSCVRIAVVKNFSGNFLTCATRPRHTLHASAHTLILTTYKKERPYYLPILTGLNNVYDGNRKPYSFNRELGAQHPIRGYVIQVEAY